MIKWLALFLVSGVGFHSMATAQETAASLLSLARKQAQEAVGKKGGDLEAVLNKVVATYGEVIEKFPGDLSAVTRARLEMARAQRRLGKSEEAEAMFKRVLEAKEEKALCCDALHDLATLYRRQKKQKEAIAVLQDLVENYRDQTGERAQALIRLGGLYRDAKDFAKAEECLRLCLKEHADQWRASVDALDDLALLKLRQKDRDSAKEVLNAHTETIKARFAGTSNEERVERALLKMSSRARLEGGATEPDDG